MRAVVRSLADSQPAGADDESTDEVIGALFEVDTASTVSEATRAMQLATMAGVPYAIALIALDLPGGGFTAATECWSLDPSLEVVLWQAPGSTESLAAVRASEHVEQVLVLPGPMSPVVLRHLLVSLTEKWVLRQAAAVAVADLEARVAERTAALEAAHASLLAEVQERERMEVELRHAQRLEAVGRLASGIAHEINTPMQYLSDNLHFVGESVQALMGLIPIYRAAINESLAGRPVDLAAIASAEEAAELALLATQVPDSVQSAFAAVDRVTTIVRSMKDLSHPGGGTPVRTDLEKLVRSAAEVARHETKLVAHVDICAEPIPAVPCFASDLGQVVLNLIVNAAHAIAERQATEQSTELGTIRIAVRADGPDAVIEIGDTGAGIPEQVRAQMFDPFFTTKPVGKGTGQGLAIAQAIIVRKHGGRIEVESEVGVGTTFRIRLPFTFAGPPPAAA